MPRPGPRPYECVRRAWHSDRHQPMRGSIIQQIFRVVNENHNPATKKNKEWQEKLPIVVFKAEEIMYSKANSEVEYTNHATLWDRLNDAVNTIIRRDESSESGEHLPPCVEAALNLGCIPVRASRSQRHSNPRTYLTPREQEPTLDKVTDERRRPISSLHPGNQLNFARAKTMNSSISASERSQIKQHNNPTIPSNPAFLIENGPIVHNNYSMTETNTPLNLGSVYPLYYGIRCPTEEPNLGSQISADASQRTIFLGRPIISSTEPAEHCLRSCKTGELPDNHINIMSRFSSEVITAREEKLPDTECDLSLRLGVPSQPCVSTRKAWALETGDIAPSCSHEGHKFHNQTIYANKEFSFFPSRTAFDSFGSCSNMWSSDGGGQNPESSTKKRKDPFSSNEVDEPFCLPPEVPSYWFNSQTKRSAFPNPVPKKDVNIMEVIETEKHVVWELADMNLL